MSLRPVNADKTQRDPQKPARGIRASSDHKCPSETRFPSPQQKKTPSRLYPLREIHRSTVASLERSKYPGLQAPLGSLRGRSPATTCRHTRADCRARLRQTILLPAHPLCSIRRSQDHGVSRPIASPAWQLLGLAVLHPCTSLVRSRHPAASELASESHLRSPGGISGPADHPARGTRASSRRSRILMHNIARS